MNRSIGIIWFDGEGFSNCQNQWGRSEEGVGKDGEGGGGEKERGKGRSNNLVEPLLVLKR